MIGTSYSMLPVSPFAVDNRGLNAVKGETVVQSMLVELMEENGQASVDGTMLVIELLNASNWMTDDEMMCRPEMQLRYVNAKRIVDGEDTTLVCCHSILIAAPIPFHAPRISWIAVSFCCLATATDIARRCTMKTRTAVNIFWIRSSHQYPQNELM